MQNLTLTSKQTVSVKPVDESSKITGNASKLNQNTSNTQDNTATQSTFQSMLNKQVQAKRTQENASVAKSNNKSAANNVSNKNANEAPSNTQKDVVEAQENQDAALEKPENQTKLDVSSSDLSVQPKIKVTDKDATAKEEIEKKITEDAAILAALMQDANNVAVPTIIDPATLKMNANVQGATNTGSLLQKTTDSLSSGQDKSTQGSLMKDLSSAFVENKTQQNADGHSENSDNLAKGQQTWKATFDEKLPVPDAKLEQVSDNSPLANLKMQASDIDAIKSFSSKESFNKELLNQDVANKDLSSVNTVQISSLNNTAINNATVASSALGSSNQIMAYPGKTGWDQAISQKVMWMVGEGEQSATLTLNPPDLGPLQVVISVNNDQADTTFISDNADVRQALQDGLNHLREKMEASGIQLGQTNINAGQQSQQSFQEATQRQFSGQASQAKSSLLSNVSDPVSRVITREKNGLVDTFA